MPSVHQPVCSICLALKQCSKRSGYLSNLVFVEIEEYNSHLCFAHRFLQSAVSNLHADIETVAIEIIQPDINNQSVVSERFRAEIHGEIGNYHTQTKNIVRAIMRSTKT